MRFFASSLFLAAACWAQGSPSDPRTEPHALHEPDSLPPPFDPRAAMAWAQDSLPSPLTDPYVPYDPGTGSADAENTTPTKPGKVFFDLRAATPFDDFQTGGRVGFFAGKRVLLDFFLDFEIRPYRRAVRIRESETLEYQYREERFTFGPGMLARIPLAGPGVAVVAGGGAGLSPAWYRGSNREAPSAGLGWLETGFRFLSPSGTDWGLSYQFFPLPGVSPHRVGFSIGYRLDE
jgi:hypothetical protein